jgi:hypothetical protein
MLWAALVGLLLNLYIHPCSFWIALHRAFPPLLSLAFAAVYLGLAFAKGVPRHLRHWLLSAVLLGLYLTLRACPLGDHGYWRHLARTDVLFLSQPMTNAVYRGVYLAFGPEALPFVSPVSGFFSALAFFTVCDRLFFEGRAGADAAGKHLCAVYYLGSGVQLIFFFNYVETTQLSVPLLFFYILALARYCRGRDTGRKGGLQRNRDLILAAFLLALAALMHGQIVFLLPSLPLAILIRRGPARQLGRMRRELLVMTASIAVVVGAAGLLLHAAGFSFRVGHAAGGGDSTLLVPLVLDEALADRRFGMFWVEHFLEVANIVVMTSPAAFALPLLLAVKGAARGGRFPLTPWFLALTALGYLGFLFVCNFDLGVPEDYDLMISMAVPLNLALLAFLLQGFDRSWGERVATWSVVVAGVALSWAFMGSFLAPVDLDAVDERVPNEKQSGIVLEAASTAPGTATLTVKNAPVKYTRGYVFYSTRVDQPIGTGPFFGLIPDAVTPLSLQQLPAEGSIFQFPYHTARLFPNAPAHVGSTWDDRLRGLTLDCVVVFLDESLKPVGVSNVARVTLK